MFPLQGLTKSVGYMEMIYAWLAKDENYSDPHTLVLLSFTLTLVKHKTLATNYIAKSCCPRKYRILEDQRDRLHKDQYK